MRCTCADGHLCPAHRPQYPVPSFGNKGIPGSNPCLGSPPPPELPIYSFASRKHSFAANVTWHSLTNCITWIRYQFDSHALIEWLHSWDNFNKLKWVPLGSKEDDRLTLMRLTRLFLRFVYCFSSGHGQSKLQEMAESKAHSWQM